MPFIKQVTELNHGAWAISAAAALNLGPINATGVYNVAYFQQQILQYVSLKKNQEFQECHFLNIQIEESTHKWSLTKHQSSHLEAKS